MGLGRIDVKAGDFTKGNVSQYLRGAFLMKRPGKMFREKIAVDQIAVLELATEEAVISVGGAAGWGIAGSFLLGPAGLVAGLVLGGRGKEVTFVCKFQDGRKFLGTASAGTFNDIKKGHMAATF